MRKVGAKSLPKWAVFVLIAVVIVGLIVYFELSYGFMFGDNGIFKPASEKNLKEFSTAVFDDLEVRRDGKEKSISVTGIPMGATVTYSPQKSFREAGTYEITATIEMEGYKTKTMTAKLTIYDTYGLFRAESNQPQNHSLRPHGRNFGSERYSRFGANQRIYRFVAGF